MATARPRTKGILSTIRQKYHTTYFYYHGLGYELATIWSNSATMMARIDESERLWGRMMRTYHRLQERLLEVMEFVERGGTEAQEKCPELCDPMLIPPLHLVAQALGNVVSTTYDVVVGPTGPNGYPQMEPNFRVTGYNAVGHHTYTVRSVYSVNLGSARDWWLAHKGVPKRGTHFLDLLPRNKAEREGQEVMPSAIADIVPPQVDTLQRCIPFLFLASGLLDQDDGREHRRLQWVVNRLLERGDWRTIFGTLDAPEMAEDIH